MAFFFPPKSPKICVGVVKFLYWMSFSLPNNFKNLDPSYKMDLDSWDCFGRKTLVS